MRDTLLRTIHDAHPLPARINSRANYHCKYCHCHLGHRVPASLAHILLECPLAIHVWSSIQLELFKLQQPQDYQAAASLTPQQFMKKYALRILFGIDLTQQQKNHTLPPIAAATHSALLETHKLLAGSLPSHKLNPAITIKRALHTIKLTARATLLRAKLIQDRIFTDYNGWTPDPSPTKEWEEDWLPIIASTTNYTLLGLPKLKLQTQGAGYPLPQRPFTRPATAPPTNNP